MAGERIQIGAESPDVNVVYLLNSIDAQQCRCHILKPNIPGKTFEQDVPSLAKYARTRPKDHHTDQDSDHRVNP